MSEVIVADTNVVSYLMKGGPLGVEYAAVLRGKVVAISFMTVAELLYGAEIAQWGLHGGQSWQNSSTTS